MELISENKSNGGWHKRFRHQSLVTNCAMTFAIYLPPQVEKNCKVPVLYWLSGLTCTDENFMQKAGALRLAAELGIAIVAPDTSPRGVDSKGKNIANDSGYDLGQGAGFYVNATQAPWAEHFQMYSYIVNELPQLIERHFQVTNKKSISGHSMGGHGALTIALKNSEQYQSVSAFSPIANPANCPWGIKAFSAYLGENKESWLDYDSCHLLENFRGNQADALPMLVEQGGADEFLSEQLSFERLKTVVESCDYPATLNLQPGYDHSYYFIASFIEAHLRFHYRYLTA